jgi:hypothetical protein
VAQPQAVGDVLEHAHVREERIRLKDHRHAALVGRHVGDVPAIEQDASGGGELEAGDQAQGGGLATAGWAEQRDELALAD